jgi:hypothetical protein
MPIANTTLPHDFVDRIVKCAHVRKCTLREELDEAILAVLHRPLTSKEQWPSLITLRSLAAAKLHTGSRRND